MLNRVDKTRKPVFKTKLSLPKVPVVIGSRTPPHREPHLHVLSPLYSDAVFAWKPALPPGTLTLLLVMLSTV